MWIHISAHLSMTGGGGGDDGDSECGVGGNKWAISNQNTIGLYCLLLMMLLFWKLSFGSNHPGRGAFSAWNDNRFSNHLFTNRIESNTPKLNLPTFQFSKPGWFILKFQDRLHIHDGVSFCYRFVYVVYFRISQQFPFHFVWNQSMVSEFFFTGTR